ncbi:hypothetical protein F0562_023146 [Nyssa sinensis]|uniref:Uncharacterized protein n=1 Tax=Nyssa sinensis TaxID=561372 RepID=A0A5J5BH71_9ASTE|nr:hypothetical protein F0562_023146 [Nyssa sinensis]
MLTPGSPASSLLSELKLRSITENARQTCKIIDEFGSFDKYIWGFVNHKPIVGQYRYPRQVPIKTSKADAISKDLVRRGFPRFQVCVAAADSKDKDEGLKAKVEEKQPEETTDLGLARAIDGLSLSTV